MQSESDERYVSTRRTVTGFSQSDPLITALYEGVSPEKDSESNRTVFYFLVNGQFNDRLSDRVSDLDIFIANTIGYSCQLLEWPCSVKEASNYPFLGKCLWKRRL